MPLYLGTWEIIASKREQCMTYFASMTPEDDLKESVGVNVLGRWSDIGTGKGAMICEADNYSDVASWLYNWVPMATCTVKPVVDDNAGREIILKQKPSYTVDYSHVGDEPQEGETLFLINYKFNKEHRLDGNNLFANLTQEQDAADAGNCRPLGRWHDLGNGTGLAVAAAKSEVDVYRWAFNWAAMCQCTVVPVLTDKLAREVISSKPDFQQKLLALKANMALEQIKASQTIELLNSGSNVEQSVSA